MQIIQFVVDLFVVYFGSMHFPPCCLEHSTLNLFPQHILTLLTHTTLAFPFSATVLEPKVLPSLAACSSRAIWAFSSTFIFKHTRLQSRVGRSVPTALPTAMGSYVQLVFQRHLLTTDRPANWSKGRVISSEAVNKLYYRHIWIMNIQEGLNTRRICLIPCHSLSFPCRFFLRSLQPAYPECYMVSFRISDCYLMIPVGLMLHFALARIYSLRLTKCHSTIVHRYTTNTSTACLAAIHKPGSKLRIHNSPPTKRIYTYPGTYSKVAYGKCSCLLRDVPGVRSPISLISFHSSLPKSTLISTLIMSDREDGSASRSDPPRDFSVTAELYVSSAAATVLRKVFSLFSRYVCYTDTFVLADATEDCNR